MQVCGQHCHTNCALEALPAVRANPVQAVVLKIIDRRFNRRMLLTSGGKSLFLFPLPVRLVELTLPGQSIEVQQLIQAVEVS